MKRVLTGCILIPLVIFIVLYTSAFWILVASSALTLLALLEFNNLAILKTRDRRADALAVLAGVVVPSILFFCGVAAFVPVLLAAVFVFFLSSFVCGRELKDSAADVAFKALGLAYIALPFSYFALISRLENGRWWIIFLFAVIWANDTFAYCVGKRLGRHRLCPAISPKKTVEGALGGLAGGIIAALLIDRFAGLGASYAGVVVLSVLLGLVGMAGDLAESVLKRGAGVKDSGTIVPGHGGVLDRTDSLIFTVPVLFYYLTLHPVA
ncbi:MAG: phosphatidate cytidylyltransferase [Thermodesulfobacteriota bacterium]